VRPKSNTPPIALVGAGPGDPGLITVAGAQLLARAEVVAFDALVNPELLNLAPTDCERIDVGKRAGHHSMKQDEINRLLVELSRSGRRVVRLKGGDPFVFGRGGEEAEALADAGVPFIVVPGVTSGVAAAAYAGIPVTHRGLTSSFTVVTGHSSDPDSSLDFAALARLDSVAFYMSVGTLAENAAALIAAGKNPDTPAAVIERGTWPTQRTVVAPLRDIAAAAAAANVEAPAVVFVGPTIALREKLNWFETRPLFGRTVTVTRTRQQASELTIRLAELGARVIEAPTIRVEPPADWADIDAELRRLGSYDWLVFTSANGVSAWAARMRSLGLDARSIGRARLAAVGPATASALDALFLRADVIPERFDAESLGKAMTQLFAPGSTNSPRVLLLLADVARPALADALAAAGAAVVSRAIYRTRPADSLPADLLDAVARDRLECVTFTSSSTVQNLFALADEKLRHALTSGQTKAACIGPSTAATFRELAGRDPDIVPSKHTIPALADAIAECLSREP
jgi:uroporphyrinogen III methyltransferase/synthase